MTSAWLTGLALLLGAQSQMGPADEDVADEDAAGARGRAELSMLVEKFTGEQRKAKAVPLAPKELAYRLGFHAVETTGIRVIANSGEEEARGVARMLVAARGLFVELTGASSAFYPYGLSAYPLDGPEAKDVFLGKHPKLAPEARARMAELEGSGIPGTGDWAFWEGDAEKRLDGLTRTGLGWLSDSQGITNQLHPWLHEGLGFYLTHALCGTYLTWFIPMRTTGNAGLTALFAQMGDPGADWMVLGRDLFSPELKFDLEELFHLSIHELDPEDHLRAHALAGYLVEVRREVLPGLFTALGEGQNPRTALEQGLGFSLAELRTRLDGWLGRREVLVARAEGRRTEGELVAQWEGFEDYQREAAVAVLKEAVGELDTPQLRWLRAVLAGAPEQIKPRKKLAYYDPKVHAPSQPIKRRRLSLKAKRVKLLLEQIRGADVPQGPTLAYDYDWGSGEVVRVGEPDDPETLFRNALLGIPPGADLARAQVLATLDGEGDRKLQAAFEHAYTDRAGSVYPITQYELWASGRTMEMPDVDTLGIVHDVLDDWTTWEAPIPSTKHGQIYKRIGELFTLCKRSRELRLSLAELFLFPASSPRPGYETQVFNLQALWAERESDPVRLGQDLPDARQWEKFLANLVTRCKRDYKLYAKGRRRVAQLRQDARVLRVALGAALDEGQAAPPPPPPEEELAGGR